MRYVADLPTVTSYFPIETKPSQVSTHSRFDLLKLLLIAGVLVIAIGTLQAQAPSDFSIIVLPDAQNESQYYPNVLASQTAWVVQNRAALNIQVFLGLGDLVNDGASDIQDGNADAAIRTLDIAGLPYFLAIGNHDYDGALPRNATGFNRWFGPARYANYSYYMGNYPKGSNENFYGVLTINGTQYLFLML